MEIKEINKVYVHVGLMKTGTTFLQKKIFPKLENINYIDNFNNNFFKTNDKNLISDESLSGNPCHSTGFTRQIRLYKIKSFYPAAKIIVCFRDKTSWVRSLYSQYVKRGGKKTFIDWNKKVFNDDYLDFDLYKKEIKNLFDEYLFLDYKELLNDPDVFIKKICDFLNVKLPIYTNIVFNKGINDKEIKFYRFFNKLGLTDTFNPVSFFKNKINNRKHWDV